MNYWYLVVLMWKKNWHVKNHIWRLQKKKKSTYDVKQQKLSYKDKVCAKIPKAKFNNPRI